MTTVTTNADVNDAFVFGNEQYASVHITLHGPPVAQPRPRGRVIGRRIVVFNPASRMENYRARHAYLVWREGVFILYLRYLPQYSYTSRRM